MLGKKWSLLFCMGLAACSIVEESDLTQVQSEARSGERYIVEFASNAGRSALAQHAKIEVDLPGAAAAYLSPAAVTALESNPAIASIEVDAKRYLLGAPTTSPYGLGMVQADQLSGGGDVTVCIIDSGLGAHHEALQHLTVTADTDPGTGDPLFDDNGHGTHVAGTIAGTIGGVNIGVAPANVSLHIVKVFTADGWAYSSTLQAGAQLCADAGAKVINMSLGGSFKSRTEQKAFDRLLSEGVLSIAAAGNDGNTRKSYPASYDSVVSVAAIDANEQIADFSQQNSQVELAAPGVSILSSTPWDADVSVTVTGEAALESMTIENAAEGTATGLLADGGLCDTALVGSMAGKIALCERGAISFFDKVANAEMSGAIATIIYNNEAGSLLATLGDGASSNYPAVTLSQADGQALASRIAGGDVEATVTAQTFFPASGYEAWNGTSMATPHVVGVAALVWAQHPSATVDEIRAALDATAKDLGAQGRDAAFGYGLVQARAASDFLGGVCTPTETAESSCGDGLDNDCDGDVDAADSDCTVACTPTEGAEVSCGDGVDNDCDGDVDAADSDCATNQCTLGSSGDSCSSNSECCSNKCKGRPGRKTCA